MLPFSGNWGKHFCRLRQVIIQKKFSAELFLLKTLKHCAEGILQVIIEHTALYFAIFFSIHATFLLNCISYSKHACIMPEVHIALMYLHKVIVQC